MADKYLKYKIDMWDGLKHGIVNKVTILLHKDVNLLENSSIRQITKVK